MKKKNMPFLPYSLKFIMRWRELTFAKMRGILDYLMGGEDRPIWTDQAQAREDAIRHILASVPVGDGCWFLRS